MEHTPGRDLTWVSAPAEFFTGRVWFGPLAEPQQEDGLTALGVQFEPEARTHWHSHPGGQVVYVVFGAGFVQNADGETVVMSAGDVVVTPPGEVHWHGATPTTHMMHLSLTTHGATQWVGPVTDADYRSASSADRPPA